MSKVESFTGINSAIKAILLNLSSFLICVLFELFRGVALITFSIYHCCVVRQKEFSRKVEMSKVESFYWNKLSDKNFSFESEQLCDLCFVLAVQGCCTDNIQHIPLVCCKTNGFFQES